MLSNLSNQFRVSRSVVSGLFYSPFSGKNGDFAMVIQTILPKQKINLLELLK